MRIHIYLFIALAITMAGCFQKGNDQYMGYVSYAQEIQPASGEGVGAEAPDFKWYNESGEEVSFREFTQGKVVLVNYWATWCIPCKSSLPGLRAINKEYADKGAMVLGIATMERTEPAYRLDFVSKFVHERGLGYQVILDNDDLDMWRAFGLQPGGVPTILLIGRDGRIARAFTGARSKEELEVELERVL